MPLFGRHCLVALLIYDRAPYSKSYIKERECLFAKFLFYQAQVTAVLENQCSIPTTSWFTGKGNGVCSFMSLLEDCLVLSFAVAVCVLMFDHVNDC